jgi:hypothetical protein
LLSFINIKTTELDRDFHAIINNHSKIILFHSYWSAQKTIDFAEGKKEKAIEQMKRQRTKEEQMKRQKEEQMKRQKEEQMKRQRIQEWRTKRQQEKESLVEALSMLKELKLRSQGTGNKVKITINGKYLTDRNKLNQFLDIMVLENRAKLKIDGKETEDLVLEQDAKSANSLKPNLLVYLEFRLKEKLKELELKIEDKENEMVLFTLQESGIEIPDRLYLDITKSGCCIAGDEYFTKVLTFNQLEVVLECCLGSEFEKHVANKEEYKRGLIKGEWIARDLEKRLPLLNRALKYRLDKNREEYKKEPKKIQEATYCIDNKKF